MALEIGLAVGGAFLSSALNVIFDRLAPEGDWRKLFQKRTHDLGLFDELENTLLGLQAALGDAENKQSSNEHVSRWLNKLQDAVEDAENIMEAINYEALKREVEAQSKVEAPCKEEALLKRKVSRFFKCLCGLCNAQHQRYGETSKQQQVSDQFLDEIMPRVEETIKTLGNLQRQIHDLGLLKDAGSSRQEAPRRPLMTSVVENSEVYGRKDEIEDLVNRLLFPVDSGNLCVIPIVGLGGLGKTTLAKMVYNDPRVQGHFTLKAWVCVSEQYDSSRITKELLGEITGSIANDTDNQIQIKLKEQIKGKKFLFILDDIWHENYADLADLKSLFVQGGSGSTVIVTTRKDIVAKMMGADKQKMDLAILPTDESWRLFERHAFQSESLRENQEFKEVGKNIALKCKGLPLALKAVGGVLCDKSDIDYWKKVLTSGIWEQSISGVLPALHFSYNDLSLHLRRCFAYLAVFPKDFAFDREYVIQLWIAHGLVQQRQTTHETIEGMGKQYFDELLRRSLIEKGSEKFIMHDLVNDLALHVSSKLCLRLEDLKLSHGSAHTLLLQRARHLSYTIDQFDTFKKLEALCKIERLRALLAVNLSNAWSPTISKRVLQNIVPKLTSLRALSLSHYWNKELPDNLFNELNQLRFLDLSSTSLRKLPDSTCKLYNLQTLLLSNCPYLDILPSNIKNLASLRYVDIRGSGEIKIQASKWKSVNVLLGANINVKQVDKCDGTRIEELGDLHNLHGSLSISELQNVDDAEKAKLSEKEHIKELVLHWGPMDADDLQIELDTLNKLCPSKKIRELMIDGYRGAKFPNWLGDPSFCELVSLSLEDCKNCDSLPSLGELPSLKSLRIKGMWRLSIVTEEFYRHDRSSTVPFKSLEELEFDDMPEWKKLHVLGNGEFPKLEHLSIRNCPELIVYLPEALCSLRKLSIVNIRDCRNLSRFSIQNKLEELKIEKCKDLDVADVPPSLQELTISECESLMSFSQGGVLAPNLKVLRLEHCPMLKSLPERMHDLLPSLKHLSLVDCPKIKSFPEGGLPFSLEGLYLNDVRSLKSSSLESLTSLQYLCIVNIPQMQSLMEEGILVGLTSLQFLEIFVCEQLQSFPENGLPCSLSELKIQDCPMFQSFPENGLPSSLSKLTISELTISVCPMFQSFPENGLPSSLSELCIWECPMFQSFPENGLPSSLSELCIWKCLMFQSFPENELPSSLSKLTIYDCPMFQSFPENGLPSSLSELHIWQCSMFQSFPENGLPSSLSKLEIRHCPMFQSFPENGLPSSLSKLTISDCPMFQSFPENGLPSSLSYLSIELEKGVDWPMVAHIPTLVINNVLI